MAVQTIPRTQFRMQLIFPLMLAIGLALGGRLFYWQILNYDTTNQRALDQKISQEPIRPQRGDILTSDGQILARETYLYTIRVVVPKDGFRYPQQLAKDLAPLLRQPYDFVYAKVLAKGITETLTVDAPAYVGEAVREFRDRQHYWFIQVIERPARQYPFGSFAAHVVGFVNREDKAAHGIEQGKDSVLRGEGGTKGGRVPIELPNDALPKHGAAVVLTINSRVQRIVEVELEKAVREARAPSGTIIVMDVKTGAILGMANYPTADLNAYVNSANLNKYSNPSISAQFEPGSIFKIITVAAALEAGTITPATTFYDDGVYRSGGCEVYNANKIAPGNVKLVDVFRLSLNVEAAKIAVGLGASKFYQSVRDFGFGSRTLIELYGEVIGEVKSVADGRWRESDLCVNAFGQGIAVTPLQVLRAIAAVANGGKLMRPYIVQEVRYADGRVEKTDPHLDRRVIRPETASIVTELLAQAIAAESSNRALVLGYRIAGKTGTASIPIPGGYDPNATIASFVGYLPADDPQLAILVKIDKPQTSDWGSEVAAPVFASVAKQVVLAMEIPPDEMRQKGK